jgi:hypothetical protein
MVEEERLLYLYGVVPAESPEPGAKVAGLDEGPVRVVRAGEIAAVVSPVASDAYSDEVLEQRLGDLQWVGERGLAHERVLDWFAERGPVVPLSLFSLHRDEERVRERLRSEAERFSRLLERLRGRREWGIRLWRQDEELLRHVDGLSPLLKALGDEIGSAPPGRQFLLKKKQEAARAEEVRSLSRRVAHRAFASLQEAADRAATLTLPASVPASGRTLLLHAAFLVEDDGFPDFQARVGELARELGGVGFEIEFTGPWPPYHFTEADGA